MGILYENGFSVDRNIEAAFQCFSKAAEMGCIKSNTKVANMFFSGVKMHKFEDFDDDELTELEMEEEKDHMEIYKKSSMQLSQIEWKH